MVLGAVAVQRANVELSTQLASGEGAVTDLTKAVCQRKIPDDKTCTFLSEQINAYAHELGDEANPLDFCGKMVQLSSATQKRDTMDYVPARDRWEVCVESILSAMETGRALKDDARAIEENIESSCKTTLEGLFGRMHLPAAIASVACGKYTDEANKALASGKLKPENGGQSFCNCAEKPCMVEKPLLVSKQCDVPNGFPMAPRDLSGEVGEVHLMDLDTLVEMAL